MTFENDLPYSLSIYTHNDDVADGWPSGFNIFTLRQGVQAPSARGALSEAKVRVVEFFESETLGNGDERHSRGEESLVQVALCIDAHCIRAFVKASKLWKMVEEASKG